MSIYDGSCHCGALTVRFSSDKPIDKLRVGRCACSFCRRHGARTLGDPDGSIEFRSAPDGLSRYRFGLGITDYLLCGKCGTYVGATMDEGDGLIGIVNVNALDTRDSFDPAPPLHNYDGENAERRRSRRRKFWMKATVIA